MNFGIGKLTIGLQFVKSRRVSAPETFNFLLTGEIGNLLLITGDSLKLGGN